MKTKRTFTLINEAKRVLLTAATLLDAIAESIEPSANIDWCDFTADEIQSTVRLLMQLGNSSVTNDQLR